MRVTRCVGHVICGHVSNVRVHDLDSSGSLSLTTKALKSVYLCTDWLPPRPPVPSASLSPIKRPRWEAYKNTSDILSGLFWIKKTDSGSYLVHHTLHHTASQSSGSTWGRCCGHNDHILITWHFFVMQSAPIVVMHSRWRNHLFVFPRLKPIKLAKIGIIHPLLFEIAFSCFHRCMSHISEVTQHSAASQFMKEKEKPIIWMSPRFWLIPNNFFGAVKNHPLVAVMVIRTDATHLERQGWLWKIFSSHLWKVEGRGDGVSFIHSFIYLSQGKEKKPNCFPRFGPRWEIKSVSTTPPHTHTHTHTHTPGPGNILVLRYFDELSSTPVPRCRPRGRRAPRHAVCCTVTSGYRAPRTAGASAFLCYKRMKTLLLPEVVFLWSSDIFAYLSFKLAWAHFFFNVVLDFFSIALDTQNRFFFYCIRYTK